MNENDLHYLAGFFDGEGSISMGYPKGPNGKRYPRLCVRVAQKDRSVLDWLVEQLGYGRVVRKYDGRVNECYDFVLYYKQARTFLALLEPYLRQKRKLAQSVLAPPTGVDPVPPV